MYNNKILETALLSLNKIMHYEDLIYSHNGILHRKINEHTIEIYNKCLHIMEEARHRRVNTVILHSIKF